MPAFATHCICALEMIEKLQEKADFPINKNALILGAQGPDIFFFHRALPWQKGKTLRKTGSALHRAKPSEIFDGLYEYCKTADEPDIAKSYACGFILHYSLDRSCHPFVYCLQNKITEKNKKENPHSAHNTVEYSLDSLMISRYFNEQYPIEFDTAKLLEYSEDEKSRCAMAMAYISGASKSDVETAIDDMKNAQRLIQYANLKISAIISALEKYAAPFVHNFRLSSFFRTNNLEKAKKYVNINNGIWVSPFSEGRRKESFFDLYEAAKSDALLLFERWQNGVSGIDNTKNISFLTGVEAE